MAEEIAYEKGRIYNFEGSWHWPWIGSYCTPSCITHQPLQTRQISLKSKKLFVDGHLRPTFQQQQILQYSPINWANRFMSMRKTSVNWCPWAFCGQHGLYICPLHTQTNKERNWLRLCQSMCYPIFTALKRY